jgi:hypothetical protein
VYQDFVEDDGSEIEQDLRLRRVPIDFTVRLTPLGRSSAVQPYIGAGLSVVSWRYSETGEFIDFSAGGGRTVFEETFVADGSETGPVVLGGVRFASDTFSVGGEVRFHAAEGELDENFSASRIDLGGWTYNLTAGIRF